MKDQNIVEEDWDNLIILDACRYDFFERVYKDYLTDGKLEKRRSRGSSTPEWLKNNFPAKYDITYVSSNAFVNTHGIPLNKLLRRCRYPWKATEHFSRIIDVWRFGWDERLATVRPEEVNHAYLSNKNKDDNRTIIHYLQPHAPYLSLNLRARVRVRERILPEEKIKSGGKEGTGSTIREVPLRFKFLIAPIVLRVIGIRNVWRLKEKLRMDPGNYFEATWREVDVEGIQYYYEDNLRKVLESVSSLMNELEGKTVITSDHGESFGEAGFFGHSSETHIPALVEVPWLVIEKPKKAKSTKTRAEQERVRIQAKKLRKSGKLWKSAQNPLYKR
jgi:hypothetical protein